METVPATRFPAVVLNYIRIRWDGPVHLPAASYFWIILYGLAGIMKCEIINANSNLAMRDPCLSVIHCSMLGG